MPLRSRSTTLCLTISSAIILILSLLLPMNTAIALTRADDLRDSIAAKQTDIAKLQKEIAELDSKLKATGEVAKTLAGAVAALDISSKKIAADIAVTESKISLANLTIEKLSTEIGKTSDKIGNDHDALGAIMRSLDQEQGKTLIEMALAGETFSVSFNKINSLADLQGSVGEKVSTLKELKTGLEDNKSETQKEQQSLEALKLELADQKKVADQNKAQQAKLLKDTKNQESTYKKLIAQKESQEKQFENDLSDFEAKLSYEIDQSKIPVAGTAALSWPLDRVIITQYFGNTSFSQQHAGVYNGKGHNGVDLGASFGTPVKAARLGTVIGTGDTDLTCPGASYGRWVFIKHDNGLSTLYAHLSVINVTEGQEVGTGQVIGYSGNTGYSTGPHLHFTLIASQGAQVGSLKSKNPKCGTYRLPIAALNGYLNPLEYLPKK